VVKKDVPPKRSSIRRDVAAAELALKVHVLASDPEMLAEMTDGGAAMREIAEAVNPDRDAGRCSLRTVYDLVDMIAA
jgi:hypothetical protein